MAKAYSADQLATGTFVLTAGFVAAILVAIRLILWIQP